MRDSIISSLDFFFIYSFMGWLIEEIYTVFKYGKFVNCGFLNGPLCPVYGVSMLLVCGTLSDLNVYPLWQFIGAVVLVTVTEYITGALMYRILGKKMWDYSGNWANLNGYICFKYSIFLGICALACLWLVHPFIYIGFRLIPFKIMSIIVLVISSFFLCDLIITILAALHWKTDGNLPLDFVHKLGKTGEKIGKHLFAKIQNRMYFYFPELSEMAVTAEISVVKPQCKNFAQGLCFDKVVWLFFVSALVGDWIETIFVWATTGEFMSRSSLLYGTFSVVWGLGGALATSLLYQLKGKNDRYIFLGGFFIGGAYEYLCSVFTEKVLHTTFWDYSDMPFNLNGRVNLLFCFFWGVLAVFWIKVLYPAVSKPIEKIPSIIGKTLTAIIILVIILDILVSSLAIGRYVQRKNGLKNSSMIGSFLDETYPDQQIERVYPNMRISR